MKAHRSGMRLHDSLDTRWPTGTLAGIAITIVGMLYIAFYFFAYRPSMVRIGRTDAAARGATIARNCATCHGSNGPAPYNAPSLAGRHPQGVITQLKEYKSGRRASPMMAAIALGLSEDEISDLAAYYGYVHKGGEAP